MRRWFNTSATIAILMLDVDGYVISWNEGAQAIHGYAAKEIIGQHFSKFYPPEALAANLPRHELEVATAVGRYEDEGWRVAQGRLAVLGQRRHHRAARRATAQLIGFCQGHARSDRAPPPRGIHCGESEAALSRAGRKACATTPSSCSTRTARVPPGTRARNRSSATRPRKSSGDISPASIRRGRQRGAARSTELRHRDHRRAASRTKAGACARTARDFWANVVITRDSRHPTGSSWASRRSPAISPSGAAIEEAPARERGALPPAGRRASSTTPSSRSMRTGFVTSWNSGAERITGYSATEIIGGISRGSIHPRTSRQHKPWRHLIGCARPGTPHRRRLAAAQGRHPVLGQQRHRAPARSGRSPEQFYIVTQDLTQRRHAETLADTAQTDARIHRHAGARAAQSAGPDPQCRGADGAAQGSQDPIVECMRQTIDRQSWPLTRIIDELLDVNRVARGQFSIEQPVHRPARRHRRAVETSRPLIETRKHNLEVGSAEQPLPVMDAMGCG